MTLKEQVMNIFEYSHKGKDHPIKIIDLCLKMNNYEPDPEEWEFPERDIRKSY